MSLMNEVESLYASAVSSYRDAELETAESLCRQVLARSPEHAEAWHLLGVLLHQCGETHNGIAYIRHRSN